MRISLFLFLGLLFAGCSSGSGSEPVRVLEEVPEHILEVENITIYPADSEPLYSIDLIPEQTFGGTGEPYLRNIFGSALDDNDRVIIWDNNFPVQKLYVYNPDGTYLTQIGRSGRGPGEFERLSNLQVKAGKILVHDLSNSRLNVYNADDYSFEESTLFEEWSARDHESVQNMRLLSFYARSDGNLLAIFDENPPVSDRRMKLKYLLVDTSGNVLNSEPLEVLSGYSISGEDQRGITLSLPFLGSSVVALSSEDAVYTAWTKDFLIKKYNAGGRYQSAFYYPVLGPPFDIDSFDGFFGYSQDDIRIALEESDMAFPETYPVMSTLRVDDENRIWVAVTVEYMETNEWWVLEESGELLAKFTWPRKKRIYDIKNGYLYSKETAEDTGLHTVMKYRIKLEER